MIRWVVFDVGNVLLNDDPLMARRFEMLYEAVREAGHSVTFEELLAERERLILEERESLYFAEIGRKYLDEGQWEALLRKYERQRREDYSRYNPATPRMEEALQHWEQALRLDPTGLQSAAIRREIARLRGQLVPRG